MHPSALEQKCCVACPACVVVLLCCTTPTYLRFVGSSQRILLLLLLQDKESLQAVLAVVDKANGCAFASLAGKDPYPAEQVYGSGLNTSGLDIWDKMHEKYEAGGGEHRLPDIVETPVT